MILSSQKNILKFNKDFMFVKLYLQIMLLQIFSQHKHVKDKFQHHGQLHTGPLGSQLQVFFCISLDFLSYEDAVTAFLLFNKLIMTCVLTYLWCNSGRTLFYGLRLWVRLTRAVIGPAGKKKLWFAVLSCQPCPVHVTIKHSCLHQPVSSLQGKDIADAWPFILKLNTGEVCIRH